MTNLVTRMVSKKPERRLSTDQCLQKGCEDGLFKLGDDGQVVDADDYADATEVDSEAETEKATEAEVADAGSLDDAHLDSSPSGKGTSNQSRQ